MMTETIDSTSAILFWLLATFVILKVVKDSINPK